MLGAYFAATAYNYTDLCVLIMITALGGCVVVGMVLERTDVDHDACCHRHQRHRVGQRSVSTARFGNCLPRSSNRVWRKQVVIDKNVGRCCHLLIGTMFLKREKVVWSRNSEQLRQNTEVANQLILKVQARLRPLQEAYRAMLDPEQSAGSRRAEQRWSC